MTASVLQERFISQLATAGSLSLAFSSPVTAGSTLHVFGSAGLTGASTTFSFADGTNSYTPLGQVDDSGNGQSLGHAYAHNVAGGATTVTVTFGANGGFIGLWIREIGGVTASPLDGHNENESAGASVSATATNTVQPAFWSGLAQNFSTTSTPSATTGTQDTTGWDFGTAFIFAVSSHNRVTTTAAQSASFTASGAAGITALMAMFNEITGGTNTTKVMEDDLVISDGFIKVLVSAHIFVKVMSDALTVADSEGRLSILDIVDNLVVSDGLIRFVQRIKVLSDGLVISDANVLVRQLRRQLEDDLTISDGSIIKRVLRRTLEDDLTIFDQVSKIVMGAGTTYTKVMTDLLTIFDEALTRAVHRRLLEDDLILFDERLSRRVAMRLLEDDLVVFDEEFRRRVLGRVPEDDLTIFDQGIKIIVSNGTVYFRVLEDDLGIFDEVMHVFIPSAFVIPRVRLGVNPTAQLGANSTAVLGSIQ